MPFGFTRSVLGTSPPAAGGGGDVEFRVWGAGGGGGTNYSNRYSLGFIADGGDGGYAVGTLAGVAAGTTFYIQVGKGGEITTGGATILFGGGARPGNGSFYGGQGGGASGVFLTNSELKNLSGSTGDVIIVAGGGGGGGNGSHGGHGGGNEGQNANTSGLQYAYRTGGLRGTQSAGGASNYGGSSTGLGLGAYSNQNLAGGGGGGWYGGSGGNNSTGGGGGSGYVGFSGSGSIPALTSTTNTVAAGSSGGVGNSSTTGNSPGNATDGTHGKVEVWIGGSLSYTFNYTGGMQSFIVP